MMIMNMRSLLAERGGSRRSPEANAYMAVLRARRGKGIRGYGWKGVSREMLKSLRNRAYGPGDVHQVPVIGLDGKKIVITPGKKGKKRQRAVYQMQPEQAFKVISTARHPKQMKPICVTLKGVCYKLPRRIK